MKSAEVMMKHKVAMDKKVVFINSKILFFLILMILMFTVSTSAYNLEEYYPLSEGNSWTYAVAQGEDYHKETFKIEGKESVEGTETIKMNVEDRVVYIAIDSQGAKKYKESYKKGNKYEIYNPPLLLFPNNVEIGESEIRSVDSILYNSNGVTIEKASGNGNITLKSKEDKEVPAGNFTNCLTFSSVMTWQEPNNHYKEDCTVWLAPGIGKVEEYCFTTEYDRENKIKDTHAELSQLISAVINGAKIEPINPP